MSYTLFRRFKSHSLRTHSFIHLHIDRRASLIVSSNTAIQQVTAGSVLYHALSPCISKLPCRSWRFSALLLLLPSRKRATMRATLLVAPSLASRLSTVAMCKAALARSLPTLCPLVFTALLSVARPGTRLPTVVAV